MAQGDERRVDLLVIGAGPAGATAALHAAGSGLDVLIVEKRRRVGEPVRCGEYVPLGLLREVPEGVVPVMQKVAGLVCDGRIFVKRSARDELFEGVAELAPAYPGAKDSWRLPPDVLRQQPDQVRDIVEQVAAVLPVRKGRKASR